MKALEACASLLLSALRQHLSDTGFNGLSWQQLVAQAAEHGLKPKTMRLARVYLRDKTKQVVLYRSKLPGCKDTKYLWALAHHPLPGNSEVISHDPEEEVSTLIAAVKAGARTLGPDGFSLDGSLGSGSAQAGPSSPSNLFRRLSDGSTGTSAPFSPSSSPRSGGNDRSSDIRDGCTSNSRRRHVPYPELEKQFGVGVSKAAANLGICKTTLKRICRQHGIKQWPRRQIAKALSHIACREQQAVAPARQPQPQAMASRPAMPVPARLALPEPSLATSQLMPQTCRSARQGFAPESFAPPIRTLVPGGRTSADLNNTTSRPSTSYCGMPSRASPTDASRGQMVPHMGAQNSGSDDMQWSASAARQQMRLPSSLPALMLDSRSMNNNNSQQAGLSQLPWVHLPQLGVSCPVYLMLPGRGM